ncbi:hypothetical protein PoB_002102200 [Plakobranchus ocellatus]|uniref:Secreted protein n=1 Tax=Plakobranchus ocellatus TaxID=259542 RepID=A0AAV3ZGS7_9GAST|nr:hypothetical protein PoB_002102200 [Plakobranchus ocellatus]
MYMIDRLCFYCTALYCTALHCTALHTVQYYTVQHSTVQHLGQCSTVQYNTILCCVVCWCRVPTLAPPAICKCSRVAPSSLQLTGPIQNGVFIFKY